MVFKKDLNLQDKIIITNITQRTVSILGGKGTGKSTTLKIVLANFAPCLLFDPIGTMRSPDAVRVRVHKNDIVKAEDAATRLNLLVKQSQNVILSFVNMLNVEIAEFVDKLMPALKLSNALVIFDEAHEFIPQAGFKSSEAERYIKHCRNWNVGVVLGSQRPAQVNKNSLALTDYLLLYRLSWHNDLEVARDVLGARYDKKAVDHIIKRVNTQGYLEGVKVDFRTH